MDRPDSRSRRWRTPLVGGLVASAVLLGGGVAAADGAGPTGTTAPSAPGTSAPGTAAPGNAPGQPAPGPAGAPAPGRPGHGPGHHRAEGARPTAAEDRTVGTVTATSATELSVTDDLGTAHHFTVSDTTRVREAGAPKAPPAGSPPVDKAPADETPAGTASLTTGQRVEVRGKDGAAVAVHVLLAHVDGVVTAVHGSTLSVTTTPGLHVEVDAHALSPVPAVGDQVHVRGTVAADGDTVVATR